MRLARECNYSSGAADCEDVLGVVWGGTIAAVHNKLKRGLPISLLHITTFPGLSSKHGGTATSLLQTLLRIV